jgi:2-iminobutanoate/2-iminopropanoate deaminase
MRKESVGKNRIGGLPFSAGVKYGDLLFISGQGPIGKDGKAVAGDIKIQTRVTLENFRDVVEAAGAKMNDVVQTTVYLKDLADYQGMNEVYSSFFSDPKPARATLRADLLFGMSVEIQGVAAFKRSQ